MRYHIHLLETTEEEEGERIAVTMEVGAVEREPVTCLEASAALVCFITVQLFSNCCHTGYDVSRSCRYSSYYSYGGLSYGFSSVTEYLFMGSGGGGGVRGSQCCGLSGRGGNGGGIIIISSPVLTGNGGAVTACATKGQDTGRSLKTAGVHGAGGGGSGGSILIMTSLSTISGVVNVDVEGGPGGTSVSSSNSNGGGGSQGQQTIVDTILSGPTYSFWI